MSITDVDDVFKRTGIEAGQIVVQRTVQEVLNLVEDTHMEPDQWFDKLNELLEFSTTISAGFEHVRSIILATIKRRWDNLPYDLRKKFSLRFDVFATVVAPDLSPNTIANRIRMAETFFLDRTFVPDKVTVVERLPDGKPMIDPHGNPVTKDVAFDPMNVDISKLTLARSAVASGKVEDNPKILEMLADPFYRYEDLRTEMFSPASKGAGIDPEMRWSFQGPVLVVERGGQTLELAEFDFSAYYDEGDPLYDLARDAVSKVQRGVGVMLDEQIIEYAQRKEYMTTPVLTYEDREERRIR